MIIHFDNPQYGGTSTIEVYSFQLFTKMLKAEQELKKHKLSFGIEIKKQFEQYLDIEKGYYKRVKKYAFVHQLERIFLAAEEYTETNCQTVAIRFRTFLISVISKPITQAFDNRVCFSVRKVYTELFNDEVNKHRMWIDAHKATLSARNRVDDLLDKAAFRINYSDPQVADGLRKEAMEIEETLPNLKKKAENCKEAWLTVCRKIVKQTLTQTKKTK